MAKENWEDVRSVDSLLEGIQPVLSAAMLYSNSTRQFLDANHHPRDFRPSTVGALEALTYSGRPVESLAEYRLAQDELEKFETLVLPEVEVLSDHQADVIREWVKHGGTLVASYRCGLLDEKRQARSNFSLADVFGVDFDSEERRYAYDANGKLRPGDFTSTYLESAGHPLAKTLAVSTVGLPGSFLKLKRTTAEEVMRYRLPFMVQDLAHNRWFNWGPPPPGTETAGTAVAHNRYGKGQSVYLGVPIFLGHAVAALLDPKVGSRVDKGACEPADRGTKAGAAFGVRSWHLLLYSESPLHPCTGVERAGARHGRRISRHRQSGNQCR